MKKDYNTPEIDLIRFSFEKMMESDDVNFDPSSNNKPTEEFNPGLDY